MTFTSEQTAKLQKKLDPSNVARRKKAGQTLSYVEGWYCEATANEIFGFDGWTTEVVALAENTQPTQNHNGNWVVSFRCTVRITAGGCVRDGVGFGSGASKDIHDAYELAIKEAQTDAEKRALKTFGNRFGLALYDKTHANVGIDEPEQHSASDAPAEPPPPNWAQERDDLTRMVQKCQRLDDLADLWRTERLQRFVKHAPQEFSSPVIQIKERQKSAIQQLENAA
ncbi:RAD52 family DNA repair protein [Roseibium sp. RKSG952]|uniref:RAD52 family DNA repair protein n=1 Tax=Roseibium sp. RKSG952 TaxID=2529384 RepID=UPI0012BBE627|nr:RAD52 family DNA repair protein [Roseibium sp. RKSG952]MTH96544.1 hypothetical protein [Roseibium sp. RKSG952]